MTATTKLHLVLHILSQYEKVTTTATAPTGSREERERGRKKRERVEDCTEFGRLTCRVDAAGRHSHGVVVAEVLYQFAGLRQCFH